MNNFIQNHPRIAAAFAANLIASYGIAKPSVEGFGFLAFGIISLFIIGIIGMDGSGSDMSGPEGL